MDIYVARQPIFDRHLNIYGYELLYRRSTNNFYEGSNDNQATAELISNAYLAMQFDELTNGTKAFINFSKELLENEIPLLLPKETTVVEILERVKVTPAIISACEKLKKKGYIIALDDFVFHESYQPLIKLADLIKIDFHDVTVNEQRNLINRYKDKIKFLAEKIETREEYQLALDMGYSYFQGYFFSKPIIITSREVPVLNINISRLLGELNQEEVNFHIITEIIEEDLGLSYKLLRLANSLYFSLGHNINSIKHALVRLGTVEIKKWIYLMMLKEIQNIENKELIKTCLIRGKLMELLALEMGIKNKRIEYYMTGMFSSIDILLNRNMGEILEELALTSDVKEALLGHPNEIWQVLDNVLNFEMADWSNLESKDFFNDITPEKFMNLYIEALKWARILDY